MKWNEFEKKILNLFQENGFWAHLFARDNGGNQPFDIIALKDNEIYAIDCKVINTVKGRFPLSRIEYNQRLAFERIKKHNKKAITGFLVEYQNEIYFINYEKIDFNNLKSIELTEELKIKNVCINRK